MDHTYFIQTKWFLCGLLFHLYLVELIFLATLAQKNMTNPEALSSPARH